MRPFFRGFAGSYWWYGPRIRGKTGQTTPERRRQRYALHAPWPCPSTYASRCPISWCWMLDVESVHPTIYEIPSRPNERSCPNHVIPTERAQRASGGIHSTRLKASLRTSLWGGCGKIVAFGLRTDFSTRPSASLEMTNLASRFLREWRGTISPSALVPVAVPAADCSRCR